MEAIRGFPPERRDRMTVRVERQRDGRVPEALLYDLRVDPGFKHQCRGR